MTVAEGMEVKTQFTSPGADKAQHVMATGAEYLVTGDNACLMHIGGVMSRLNAGVRTIHLAEILARTEGGDA